MSDDVCRRIVRLTFSIDEPVSSEEAYRHADNIAAAVDYEGVTLENVEEKPDPARREA